MLDTKSNKRQILKYFIMSIFFLIFALIYESFSHGVFSSYMMFAFLIPLLMGCLIYGILYYARAYKYLSKFAAEIFNSAILTFTFGSVMKGVLEIYGTTNNLISIYFKLGILLIIISIAVNIIYNLARKDKDIKNE